jgi:hypothetical protein
LRKTKSKIKESKYSIIKKLKEENLIDDRFLVRISNLPLEDIIAIKLESLSHKINGKMFKPQNKWQNVWFEYSKINKKNNHRGINKICQICLFIPTRNSFVFRDRYYTLKPARK